MKRRIQFLIQYIRKYILGFILLLFVIIITTAIVAFYPYLFGKLVDSLFYRNNVSEFFKIGVIYFIAFAVNQSLHYVLNMTLAKLNIGFVFDIKKAIFNKVLSYKSKQLSEINSGDVIERINYDTDEILSFIKSDIFYGISALLDFSMCLGISAFISLPLAGVSFVLVVITLIVSNYLKKKLSKYYYQATQTNAEKQSWLFEFINGMRDIRLMNAIKHCVKKFMSKETDLVEINRTIMKKEVMSERINAALQVVASLSIFTIAAFSIASNALTLGGLTAIIDYYNRMIVTLNRIYSRFFSITKRLISIDRIIEIEDKESEEYNEKEPLRKINHGEIIFNNVHFSYNEQQKVLNGIDLYINAGEKIALVGQSGVGKSTIAALLCRMYDAEQGEITIDGVNINKYSLSDLRGQIGLVNQTTTIFNNTVRYNLIFSNDKEHDEEIWKALRYVEMDGVVRNLPQGLDTILDASKTSLSGGQNQRLSIARVYLKKPNILILDESTSALDGNTEFNITKAWDELFPKKTIIIIAHRLSTIVHSDRIAYLENGHIIKCGKHEELFKTCPQYKKNFYEQYYTKIEGVNYII